MGNSKRPKSEKILVNRKIKSTFESELFLPKFWGPVEGGYGH